MTDTPADSTKKVTATPKNEKKLDGLVPEVPSMTDKPLLSTPKKLTPKKSAATPEKMVTPKKIPPKKMATPNKKTTPEKKTPNKKSPKMDGLVPQMKGSNEETDYLRKETESNNSRDRRIRKLEEDVKALKEDNKYLRRKVRKLEERNSLQEVNGEVKQQSSVQEVKEPSAECSTVSAQQEVTIDDIKKCATLEMRSRHFLSFMS